MRSISKLVTTWGPLVGMLCTALIALGAYQAKYAKLAADVDELKATRPELIADRLGRDEDANNRLAVTLDQMSADLHTLQVDVGFIKGQISKGEQLSTAAIPISTTTINLDTAATANTGVMRGPAAEILAAAIQGTSLTTTGNFTGTVQTKTGAFTAGAATDYLVDATAGAFAVAFPTASANPGVIYNIIKKDATGNAVTLTGVSGTGSLTSQYQKVRVFSDGTNWYSV